MKKFLLNRALAAKKKFISVLLLALASVCTVNAQTNDTVLVDGLYYILVTGGASPFAYVTSKGDYYTGNFAADQLDYVSGDLVIPSTVTYNAVDYPVTKIDAGAFSRCRRLKSVVIPNTVTHIVGDYRAQFTGAFYGCDSLTSVTLSENLAELGAFAFSYCSALPEITLPESLRTIGYNAFQDCQAMRTITIPEGVTFIDASAFEYCRGLQSISLPSTLTQIAYRCFVGCHELDTVYSYALTPPNIYREIATEKAFYDAGVSHAGNYYGLKYMKLYVPLEALSAYQAAADWDVCQHITAIGYDVYEVDGILYKRDPVAQTAEVTFKEYDYYNNSTAQRNYVSSEVVIPETFTDDHGITYTVTSIGEAAFRGCRNLRTMTLPRTITQIGAEAFEFVYSLQSINFPDLLLSIGYNAFRDASLRTVVLTNVNSLGDGAFARCEKLQEVELPALAEIKTGTFAGCTALKRIAVNATTPPTVGNGAFQDITLSGVDCFVPDDSFSAYEAAEVWTDMHLRLLSDYKILIHEVSLTVEWPSMGTAIESFHPYGPNEVTTTTCPANAVYEVESYLFFTPSGGRITEATLQPGTEYLVRVNVVPYSGYEFADDLEIRINGYAPIQIYKPGTGGLLVDTKFTTEGGLTVTVSEGALTGLFSVAEGKQIVFSKGNLQYQASTQTWRFAEHQWDKVSGTDGTVYEGGVQCDNSLISPTYTGWIDLFGWGTGDNPTKTSTDCEEYTPFVDWGTNAISNGGNQPNLWRTMAFYELHYLLFERPNAANLRAYGNIDESDPKIFVLLPDDWVCPAGVSYDVTTFNYFTSAQIASMEAAGAVFLPVTAMRTDEGMVNWGNCLYWTSDPDECNAMSLNFSFGGSTRLHEYDRWSRSYGLAVRLVQEPQLQISTVSLEFEAPTAGQSIEQAYLTPDSAAFNTIGRASVSTKAGYEIAGYGFYTQAGEPFTGTFQANTAYKVQVRLRAKDGYTFPMQSANPTTPDLTQLTISLNGAAAANPQAWNTGEISAEYSFTTTTPVFTVRFLDWNGAVLSTQSVEMGQDAVAPADPTREGYIFIGWDREFTNIQANTFITARYKQLITNVILSFEFPRVGQQMHANFAAPGDADYNVVGRVALPEGVGYEVTAYAYHDHTGSLFVGVFTPNDYSVTVQLKAKEGYAFPMLDDQVTPDITQISCLFNGAAPDFLNAWDISEIGPLVEFTVLPEYTVRFLDWDGTVLSTQTVTQGQDAVAPAFPSHSGYYFAGWDHEFTNVQADIDVTAQYLQAIYEITPTFVFPAAGDTVTNDVMTPTHELYNVLGQISVPDGAPFHVRSYQFTDANSNYINSNSFDVNGEYSVQIILEPNEGYAFGTTYEWDWGSVIFSVNGQAPYAAMAAPNGGMRLWVRFATGKIPVREVKVVTTLPQAGDSIITGVCYSDDQGALYPLSEIMNFTSGLNEAGYYCDGVDIWADDGYNYFDEEALLPNTNYFARFYVTVKDNYIFPADLNTVDVTVNDSTPLHLGFTGFEKDRIMFSVWFNSGLYKLLDVEAFVTFPAAGQPTKYEILSTDSLFNVVGQATVPDGANYSVEKYAFYAEDGNLIEESTFLPNTSYRMSVIIRPNENYAFPKREDGYVDDQQLNSHLINGEPVMISLGDETIGLETFFTTGNILIHEVDVESMVFPKVGENVSNLIVTLADESHCTIDGMYIYNKDNSWPFGNDALEANLEYSAQVNLVPEAGYAFADDVVISVAGTPAAKVLANESQQIFYVLFTPVQLITEVNLTVEAPKAGDAVLGCHNYDPATSDVATVNCPPGAPYTCTKYTFYKGGECFDEAQLLGETEYWMGIELTAADGYTFPTQICSDGYERVMNEQITFIINGVEVYNAEQTVGAARVIWEFTTGKTEGLNNVEGGDANVRKIMRNGILYIIRNGKTYNGQGALVE